VASSKISFGQVILQDPASRDGLGGGISLSASSRALVVPEKPVLMGSPIPSLSSVHKIGRNSAMNEEVIQPRKCSRSFDQSTAVVLGCPVNTFHSVWIRYSAWNITSYLPKVIGGYVAPTFRKG
jgi:hypothetical protein